MKSTITFYTGLAVVTISVLVQVGTREVTFAGIIGIIAGALLIGGSKDIG